MAVTRQEATIVLFRTYIQQQNWLILEEKLVQNGLQLVVAYGTMKTPVVCFTNGNALIQGAANSLKTQLQTWWNQQKVEPSSSQEERRAQSSAQQRKIDAFREYARVQQWSCVGKEIHQGIYQLHLTHNTTTASVNFYPTGTVLNGWLLLMQ